MSLHPASRSRNHKNILAIEPGTKDYVDTSETVFSELIKRGLNSEEVRIGIMGARTEDSILKKGSKLPSHAQVATTHFD